MLELYTIMFVIFLMALIFCVFVYKALFSRKNGQPTEKRFSVDQEQEIKFILQEIENASKSELEGIMERGASLLPDDCRSILQVACDERLIKLGLKAQRDSFENREISIRRQWLVMFIIFFLLIPLRDVYFLWITAVSINQWVYPLVMMFLRGFLLYYFAYVKKGTNWLVVVMTVSVIKESISLIGLLKVFHETGEFSLDYFVSLALALLPVWFCYRLYKINCEAKGRENLKKVTV